MWQRALSGSGSGGGGGELLLFTNGKSNTTDKPAFYANDFNDYATRTNPTTPQNDTITFKKKVSGHVIYDCEYSAGLTGTATVTDITVYALKQAICTFEADIGDTLSWNFQYAMEFVTIIID